MNPTLQGWSSRGSFATPPASVRYGVAECWEQVASPSGSIFLYVPGVAALLGGQSGGSVRVTLARLKLALETPAASQLEVLGACGCRTAPDFADAISHLSDPESRQRLSDNIRQKAHEHFSLASFGERLQSMIGRGAPSNRS